MIVFEIAGRTWPLEDTIAEALAVALRLDLADGSTAGLREGRASLADTIEAALVGENSEPIPVDEGAALALFHQLNALLRDPDTIDPTYSLYLELRRYLGRLYS